MKAKLGAVLALLLVAALGNAVAYRNHVAGIASDGVIFVTSDDTPLPPAPGHAALDWGLLSQTRRDRRGQPTYPPAVLALQGQLVEVSGFGFQLRSGLRDGAVHRFALMPPSLSGCCGPVCTPSPERTALVDLGEAGVPAGAWGDQAGLYARVQGILTLADTDSLGCLFTVKSATAALYKVAADGRAEPIARSPPSRR